MFGNDNNNYNPSSAYMTYPVRHGAYIYEVLGTCKSTF